MNLTEIQQFSRLDFNERKKRLFFFIFFFIWFHSKISQNFQQVLHISNWCLTKEVKAVQVLPTSCLAMWEQEDGSSKLVAQLWHSFKANSKYWLFDNTSMTVNKKISRVSFSTYNYIFYCYVIINLIKNSILWVFQKI